MARLQMTKMYRSRHGIRLGTGRAQGPFLAWKHERLATSADRRWRISDLFWIRPMGTLIKKTRTSESTRLRASMGLNEPKVLWL